jgi:hypothetical protein
MTKKDFFSVLLKLFGLLSVISTLFSLLPSMLSIAFAQFDLWAIVFIILSIAIVVGLFVLLIFKSNAIVRLLKLDKGFDNDTIDLGTFNAESVVKLGSFVIGGLLIIDNIPVFLSYSYLAINDAEIGQLFTSFEKLNWLISLIKIILGFLLVTNYSFVAKLLRVKEREKE